MRIIPYPWATRQFFSPDDPPAGGGDPVDPAEAELTDKGKAALLKERTARKAAETKLTDIEATVADLAKWKSDREAADATAAADRAKAQGQFEQVAKDAETARDAAMADLTTAQETIKGFTDAMSAGLKERFEAIPELVRNTYRGGEDDVLAKFAFINDPGTDALIKALDPKAEANRGNGNPVNPADPNAPKVKPEDARASQAPMYNNW